jgi:hypothetical protein
MRAKIKEKGREKGFLSWPGACWGFGQLRWAIVATLMLTTVVEHAHAMHEVKAELGGSARSLGERWGRRRALWWVATLRECCVRWSMALRRERGYNGGSGGACGRWGNAPD